MTLWVCVNISASRGLLGFKDMSVFVQVKSSKSPMTEVMIHYLYGICRNFDAKYGLLIIWGRKTLLAEKKKMNDVPVSTAYFGITAIFEKYEQI